MNEPAQSLGQRLKAERERRAMSTQKAADDMHLDAWVIEALEAGEYQRIGPSVYAKGHLKRYATILGLTPADIAAGYDAPPAVVAASGSVHPGSMLVRTHAERGNLPWAQILSATVVALTIGGIIWWQPWRARSASRPAAAERGTRSAASAASTAGDLSGPAAATQPGEADTAGGPTDAAGAASSGAANPGAASAAGTSAPAANAASTAGAEAVKGAGPAHLRLRFSADSWVEVHDAAGRTVFAGTGRANSVKMIAGDAPLKVYLGFASGVQLELNDRVVAIGPQFMTGDVARFEAGADGVLRRDPAPRAASPHG
jgi:cytoskeleton protein RodZ